MLFIKQDSSYFSIPMICECKKLILTSFINFENEIYFRIIDFSFPLIDALENDFNQKFRKNLKLGTTDTLNKKLAEILILIQKWENYTYKKQEFPFALAGFRAFSAPPTLNLEGKILQYQFLKQ